MRATNSGTLIFGMVAIPVKVYSAVKSDSGMPSFNLLHRSCGARLKQNYVCSACEETVSRDEMVKGYEHAKGEYVVLTPEDIAEIQEEKSDAMEIECFVRPTVIDSLWLDKPSFLGPDRAASKSYGLLARAMAECSVVAIVRQAARGRAWMAVVRSTANGTRLVMQRLRYAETINEVGEVPVDEARISDAEVELAKRLIQASTDDVYDHRSKVDESVKRAMAAIQRKVEGLESVVGESLPALKPAVEDLMEQLKASIAARSH